MIGGVALLVIIAALAFCLGRRRRPAAPETEAGEPKTVSLEDEHTVLPTPYVSERDRTEPFNIDGGNAPATPAPLDTLTTSEYHTARTDQPLSPARSSPGSSTAYLIAKGETLAAMSARGSAQSSPITPTTPGGGIWPAVAGASTRTKSARVPLPSPTPVPEPRPRRVEQEQDAGSLDEPEEELEPELVPPSYNPDWAARRDDSTSPSPSPTRPRPAS